MPAEPTPPGAADRRIGGAPDAIVPVGSATETESTLTVLIAFGANLLIAVAKTLPRS